MAAGRGIEVVYEEERRCNLALDYRHADPWPRLQSLATLARTGEELGFAIDQCERPHHHPKGHRLHLSLQRERHICRQSHGRVPGAAVAPELPGGRHVFREAAHLGHGAAAPSTRAHGKNAGDY